MGSMRSSLALPTRESPLFALACMTGRNVRGSILSSSHKVPLWQGLGFYNSIYSLAFEYTYGGILVLQIIFCRFFPRLPQR